MVIGTVKRGSLKRWEKAEYPVTPHWTEIVGTILWPYSHPLPFLRLLLLVWPSSTFSLLQPLGSPPLCLPLLPLTRPCPACPRRLPLDLVVPLARLFAGPFPCISAAVSSCSNLDGSQQVEVSNSAWLAVGFLFRALAGLSFVLTSNGPCIVRMGSVSKELFSSPSSSFFSLKVVETRDEKRREVRIGRSNVTRQRSILRRRQSNYWYSVLEH